MGSVRGWRLRRARRSAPEATVIDLRDAAVTAPAPLPAHLPAIDQRRLHAQLVARRNAELARAEAQQELERLRRRHWSPDRIFEESRLGIDWWEHPQADPHAVLGLLPGDSLHDAGHARRSIARAVHPDVAGEDTGGDAERQMAAVNGAYDRIRRALAPLPDVVDEDRTDGPRPGPWAGAAGEVAAG